MEESNSACPNAFKRDHDQKAPSPLNGPRVKTDHPVTGLRLGGRGDSYENGFLKVSMLPSVRALKGPMKRSRASYQNMQSPCCQVEGCNLDLRAAKDYHRRHRICESHSKSPKVIVAGMERRFCQQCSRFHDLSEFDDKKRSCRRRLSDHNTRRRRVQPECGQLGSARLSSPFYDQRQEKHWLLNKLPISLSNPTWENANTSTFGEAIFRPWKSRGLDGPSCFTVDDMMNKSIFQLHTDLDKSAPIHTLIPRFLDQCCENPQIAPGLLNAHSLLSSSTTWSWSLNEGEPTSTMDDGIMLGNYTHPVIRKSNFESQNFQSFSDNIPVEQGAGATMVHSVDNLQGYPHQQEYQLFKAPYESSGF